MFISPTVDSPVFIGSGDRGRGMLPPPKVFFLPNRFFFAAEMKRDK
jgi:hypothetical protein